MTAEDVNNLRRTNKLTQRKIRTILCAIFVCFAKLWYWFVIILTSKNWSPQRKKKETKKHPNKRTNKVIVISLCTNLYFLTNCMTISLYYIKVFHTQETQPLITKHFPASEQFCILPLQLMSHSPISHANQLEKIFNILFEWQKVRKVKTFSECLVLPDYFSIGIKTL